MKTCLLVLVMLVLTIHLSAQKPTPKSIEIDLLKSFNRINYWGEHQYDTTNDTMGYENLHKANNTFRSKLKNYTQMYPTTISQNFIQLKKRFNISSSDDSLFRIYSWDTETGGTMHFFESVFQYRYRLKTISFFNASKSEADYDSHDYRKLYTFKTNNQTYYLAVWLDIGSTKVGAVGIQAFSIENGKLNDKVKLIKTSTGLDNELYYEYDNGWDKRFDIYFDASPKTIRLPLINSNGELTRKFITYKFTGKYFEKVKS